MPKKYLRSRDIKKIINSAPSLRDRIIIKLLARTGMGRAELRNLNIRDIDSKRHLIRIRNNPRSIPVDDDTLKDMEFYMGSRRKGRLIRSQKSETISLKEINMITRKCGLLAGVKNPDSKFISPRALRYSFMIHAKKAGMPAEFIQMIVGHSSIKTTLESLNKPSTEELRVVYRKIGDLY